MLPKYYSKERNKRNVPSGIYGDAIATKTISLNQWYHIAGVYDGSTMKLYGDGQLLSTLAFSYTPPVTNSPLTIGYAGYHTHHRGMIDDVVLYNTALSGTEIEDHVQQNLAQMMAIPEQNSLILMAICLVISLILSKVK